MTTHRNLDGSWAECEEVDCGLKFHFPDLTVAEAEAMPFELLLPLLNEIDPPTFINPGGQLWWQTYPNVMHRDYDLPAWIDTDGAMEWWVNGELHRDGGKYAWVRQRVLFPYGRELRWYEHGAQTRPQEYVP